MTACAKTPRGTVLFGKRIQLATPNTQRPTLNWLASLASTWKNDYSIAACALSGWLTRCQTREPQTTLPASFFAMALRRMATTAKSKLPNPRKDFVHKLKVCLKELKETLRW